MKRISYLLMPLLLILFFTNAWAVTQINFFVNNAPVTTIVQGDTLVWRVDCAVGATVWFELWMDLNNNQVIDAGDIRLFRFSTTDGDSTGQNGPPDLDGLNGFITSSAGAFGFAPISWIFYAEEGNTSAYAALTVQPLPNPPATISGKVTFEDGKSPANVLVTTTMEQPPFWNALTDANGNYTINLGEADKNYTIMTYYPDTYYLPPPPQTVFASGNVTGVDFLFRVPAAQVVGDLLDDSGNPLTKPIGMVLIDAFTNQDVNWGQAIVGHYRFGANAGSYRFDFDESTLNPDYLAPDTWNNPYFTFQLQAGDSLVKNITFYRPDTAIFAKILLDGTVVNQKNFLKVHARNDTTGRMAAYNNANGIVRLPVKSGHKYAVEIYSSDMPVGYGLPGGNYRYPISPGDTVIFNFVNFTETVVGLLRLDPGDPFPNYNEFTVYAQQNNTIINTREVQPTGHFLVEIPNTMVDIGIWNPGNYLVKPRLIQNVQPGDSINFDVNYANARIVGHLKGLTIMPDPYTGVSAHTSGVWPDWYETWAAIGADTSYTLNVCEGTWTVQAPVIGNAIPNPQEVVVTVPETDTTIVVDFNYTPTGIEESQLAVPQDFVLAQNYPNPFNPVTHIRFGLPKKAHVVVEIFNLLGQKVATLTDKDYTPGFHTLKWNASNMPSGVYIYRLNADGKILSRKMLLLR